MQKNQLHSIACELFSEQDLVSVFAAQTVRCVHQHGRDLALGRQVAHRFQARSRQGGATIAFVLKLPLRGDAVAVRLRVLQQGGRLAGNGVGLLLAVGGHSGIEGGELIHASSPEVRAEARVDLAPRVDRLGPVWLPASGPNDIPVAGCGSAEAAS